MIFHNEFMEEVKEVSSLPAQIKKALGPESKEDHDDSCVEQVVEDEHGN